MEPKLFGFVKICIISIIVALNCVLFYILLRHSHWFGLTIKINSIKIVLIIIK